MDFCTLILKFLILFILFIYLFFIYLFNLWILERDKERKGEREKNQFIVPLIHLCIYWLILVCALTGDRTDNLGVLGQHSNQLSKLARAVH